MDGICSGWWWLVGASGAAESGHATLRPSQRTRSPQKPHESSLTTSPKKSASFASGERRSKMSTERRLSTPAEIRARHERKDRVLEELRASNARKKAIVERWRAEAGWPPLEPRRPV